jgi:hypothetical protein
MAQGVVDAGYIPASRKAYGEFTELDKGSYSFSSKKVSNTEDAGRLAFKVKERTGSDMGVSVLTPFHEPLPKKLYMGISYRGSKVSEEQEISDSQNIQRKISDYVIENILEELEMKVGDY